MNQANIKNPVIRLDLSDNVVVARQDLPAGLNIESEHIILRSDVPAGYKVATQFIPKGEAVKKYNIIIGFAKEDTLPGTMMHSHNIVFHDYQRDYAYSRDYVPTKVLAPEKRASFQGIIRADGRVATRNYIGIIAISHCAATVTQKIARYFTEEKLKDYPNVDGVVPFTHDQGCGGDSTAGPLAQLRRTLGGYAKHPNFAAVILVGVGCERNAMPDFMEFMDLHESDTLKVIIMEDEGGTRKSVEKGVSYVKEFLPKANQVKREPVSAEHLIVGLKCGGSDGFSGLTANPALGVAADLVVKNGGTVILSETSEIYGVEQTLTCRAVTPEVGKKLVDRMDWWKNENCVGRDMQINGRVSPGNNKGGLANVFEKSLGGVKKGGSTGLMEVYQYAEPVIKKGLVFMDSSGYDPVAITGEIAGGANLCAFTTGRGSCFGSYPSPTIKLATNTPMYERMEEDMDINCGAVIDGEKTLEEMGKMIFQDFLKIASGEKTKSEALGVGYVEFVPWRLLLMG